MLEEIYNNGEKIDSCLVGEPTCPNNLGEMIKIGRRGSMTTTIKVSGKQGHVAYPEWTLNPINPLTSICLLYTSPSPRDKRQSRMPSSA